MKPIFPKYTDTLVRAIGAFFAVAVITGIAAFAYFSHPLVQNTGYRPEQPVPYSHKLHAGNLGMDCYYCHNTVTKAAHAAVPATETCMNCHTRVKTGSAALAPVRESYATGKPVQWVKVHSLPDYAYFNHSSHVTVGVSCVSCHGRVDQMVEVQQVKPLNMGWCLECHRNPAPNLRPVEFVTKLDWQPDRDPAEIGREIIKAKGINPPVNCGGCHR
jgi:menaquinone reductase, multiheme cytochrome c subunit